MTAALHRCIWCLKPSKGSLEHILPESLGCPENFVLRDGVCQSCNNGLAHIDQALLHEFEIVTFLSGVPRKGGRPPMIDSWSAIAANKTAEGPTLYMNGGPQPVHALGKKLLAAKPSNGIKNVSFKAKDGIATMSFDQTFGRDPKFVRAVHKVALGNLAFFEGLEAACHEKYNGVRAFVREGKGNFRVLLLEKLDDRRSVFGSPWAGAKSTHSMVGMTILGVSLVADLDPEQKGLAHIRANAPKEERLAVIPPN